MRSSLLDEYCRVTEAPEELRAFLEGPHSFGKGRIILAVILEQPAGVAIGDYNRRTRKVLLAPTTLEAYEKSFKSAGRKHVPFPRRVSQATVTSAICLVNERLKELGCPHYQVGQSCRTGNPRHAGGARRHTDFFIALVDKRRPIKTGGSICKARSEAGVQAV